MRFISTLLFLAALMVASPARAEPLSEAEFRQFDALASKLWANVCGPGKRLVITVTVTPTGTITAGEVHATNVRTRGAPCVVVPVETGSREAKIPRG